MGDSLVLKTFEIALKKYDGRNSDLQKRIYEAQKRSQEYLDSYFQTGGKQERFDGHLNAQADYYVLVAALAELKRDSLGKEASLDLALFFENLYKKRISEH